VAEIMQAIKGAPAHKINHLLERTGQFGSANRLIE